VQELRPKGRLCWAGVPVWESLKVTLEFLKFGNVAVDDRFGA
jgi:hypothetical protein